MRTEQDLIKDLEETLTREILKEFEKLGYLRQFGDDVVWCLRKIIDNRQKSIDIHIRFKAVCCSMIINDRETPCYLEIQELKLLNELFELWGWIE